MSNNKKGLSPLIIRLRYFLSLKGVTRAEEIATLLHVSLSSYYAKCRDPDKLTLADLNKISQKVNKPVWELLKLDDAS